MRQILVIALMLLVWSCSFANKLFTDPAKVDPDVSVETMSLSTDQPQPDEQMPVQQAQARQNAAQTAPMPAPPTTQAVQVAQAPSQVQAPAQVLPPTQPAYVQSVPNSSDDSNAMDRVERRKEKAQRFAAGIDSLVSSHSFRFLPNSMQELPGGWTQLIYNELYFIGVFKDHVEVHMPTIRGGIVQYFEVLNFDTFEVRNYQASKTQYGWNVSFNLTANNDAIYTVNMLIYTLTGETVLNLLTLSNTIRYVGYIQPISKN